MDNLEEDIAGPTIDGDTKKQIEQQLGTARQRIIPNAKLTALQQAVHPGISSYNLDQMLLQKARGNTNAFVIAYANLLDQLNNSYQIVDQPQPSVTPGLDSLQAGIVVATNLLTYLENTYSLPPSLRQNLQSIIVGITQVQAVPTGAYPEVVDLTQLKTLLLQTSTSPEQETEPTQ